MLRLPLPILYRPRPLHLLVKYVVAVAAAAERPGAAHTRLRAPLLVHVDHEVLAGAG